MTLTRTIKVCDETWDRLATRRRVVGLHGEQESFDSVLHRLLLPHTPTPSPKDSERVER